MADDIPSNLSGCTDFDKLDKFLDQGVAFVRKDWGGRRVRIEGGKKDYSLVQIWKKVEEVSKEKKLSPEQRAQLFNKVIKLDADANEALRLASPDEQKRTERRSKLSPSIKNRTAFTQMQALLQGIPDTDTERRAELLKIYETKKEEFAQVDPHVVASFCEDVGKLPPDQRAGALGNTKLLHDISVEYTYLKKICKKDPQIFECFWNGVRCLPVDLQAWALVDLCDRFNGPWVMQVLKRKVKKWAHSTPLDKDNLLKLLAFRMPQIHRDQMRDLIYFQNPGDFINFAELNDEDFKKQVETYITYLQKCKKAQE